MDKKTNEDLKRTRMALAFRDVPQLFMLAQASLESGLYFFLFLLTNAPKPMLFAI